MEIEEKDLLDLIHWARRYCDYRSTYATQIFNDLYDRIVQLNPSIKDRDKPDTVLHSNGKFWPYAQDGMFDERSGRCDARPKIKSQPKEE